MRHIVRVTMEDVYNNCHNFTDHKDYIQWRFLQDFGVEVTAYDKLNKLRSDSDDPKTMHFEYHGTEGESVRKVTEEGKAALSLVLLKRGAELAGRN